MKNIFPLPPQPLKPCRVGRRVHDSVLHIPVSEIVLAGRVQADMYR